MQYDGRRVVSGAYDYLVKVWEPLEGTCLFTLEGHTNRVYSLQVGHVCTVSCCRHCGCVLQFDETHIVSGSLDTSIRVWNAENGQCLHTLIGALKHTHSDAVTVHNVFVLDVCAGHQSLTSGMEMKRNVLVSGNADSTVKVSHTPWCCC